jgi:hypothetical protein
VSDRVERRRRLTPEQKWQVFLEASRKNTDPRLCAALVDRLTFGGTIIETGTDSYRLAQSNQLRG